MYGKNFIISSTTTMTEGTHNLIRAKDLWVMSGYLSANDNPIGDSMVMDERSRRFEGNLRIRIRHGINRVYLGRFNL